MDFNALDIGIMAIIGLSTIIGIYRGIFRELITITVWAIGAFLAFAHGKNLGQSLTFVSSEYAKQAVAQSIIFIAVVIIGMILRMFLFKAMNIGGPSALDRILGTLFGAARGVAIIVITMVVAVATPIIDQKWYDASKLVDIFQGMADDLSGVVPGKWKASATRAGEAVAAPVDTVAPVDTATPVETTEEPPETAAPQDETQTTPPAPTEIVDPEQLMKELPKLLEEVQKNNNGK